MARIITSLPGLAAILVLGACQSDRTGPQPFARLVDRVVFQNVGLDEIPRLYHVELNGGEPVLITSGSENYGCPSVSPDGSMVVISGWSVKVADADGSDLSDLQPADTDPFAGFSCASWSPDGTRFAVVRRLHRIKSSGSSDVFVMSPDGSAVNRIAAGDSFYQAIWEPNGERILFSSSNYTDGGPYNFAFNVVGSDGSNPLRTPQSWAGADWSPDASRVAFVCGDTSSRQICVSQPDGMRPSTLTPSGMNAGSPDWAPVGNTVAFACGVGICTISADGTGLRTIVPSGGPFAWSPDAQLIVYSRGDELRLVKPDGSGDRLLVTVPGINGIPAFSPMK